MAARLRFLKDVSMRLPKLSNPPNYEETLNAFLDMSENKTAAVTMTKEAFDRAYEDRVREQFGDDKLTRKCMDEARMAHAITLWNRRTGSMTQHYTPSSIISDLSMIEQLKLPAVGCHVKNQGGKGRKNNAWDLQTYENFASKTIKRNPGAELTKVQMDNALQYAISKVARTQRHNRASPEEVDKALKRCLGKVSKEFWEKRDRS